MKEYRVKIEVLSDFMPGSGESVPGLVDNDSRYDANGLPFMNAKTFKGHIREQMENVVAWRDLDINPDVLLGSSDINSEKKPGKLKFSDVILSKHVIAEIKNQIKDKKISAEEVTDAITVIYAFTKIDENGVAEDHTLRRVRMVNGGLVFYTSIFAEDLTDAEEELLKDSVRAVQHIGTYKSKGKGLVRCEITDVKIIENENSENNNNNDNSGNYVTFNILLEEPVKMGGQGNQSNTTALNYITGSSIRGAVIDKYIKKKLNGNGSMIDEDSSLSKMLLKDTRFFDAYICVDDKAMIPMPMVFYADKHEMRRHKQKEERGEESDLTVNNRANEKPAEGELKVGVNNYCYPVDKDTLEMKGVRKCANLHINTVSDDMFRYEAIEKGQVFFGIIKCADNTAATDIASLIAGEVMYLGGSKGSGYGRCHIKNSRVVSYEDLLKQYGVQKDEKYDDAQKKELVIYALSNLILCDTYGNAAAHIGTDYLEEKLGISKAELKGHFVSSVETSGYNHKWKAGNIQRTAVKAGSYFKYEYEGTIDKDKLLFLEEDGIGQRKQEGFGRILFNPHLSQTKLKKAEGTEIKDLTAMHDADDTDKAFLSKLINKINNERLSGMIQKTAMGLSDSYMTQKDSDKLSKTQIGRIYNLLTDRNTSKENVIDYINHIKDKAKTEYEKSYVFINKKTNFLDALRQLSTSEESWLAETNFEMIAGGQDDANSFFEINKALFSKILYLIMRKGGERNG